MGTPWVTAWGEDHWSWNVDTGDEDDEGDGTGRPGRMLVASAIACWCERFGSASPRLIAAVFNLPLELVFDALSERALPGYLPSALQVWSLLQSEEASIIEASCLFAMTPGEATSAVSSHYYMFVEVADGGLVIAHDGE